MVERQMQSFFTFYLRNNPPQTSEAYELKMCKGNALPFNHLADHQLEALLKASQSHLYYRILDQPWIKDRPYTYMEKKPFDCFVLVKVKSYVVVWFYHPAKKKVFYKIPVEAWVKEQKESVRKSLTEVRAQEIGIPVFIT